MAKRMLIDASHPEETRVVVLSGNRLEDFDYETASRKQLKGNIYLAKITRVEPSLQAAFVDYGGNRHGFLPFSEIHPDYYRIPVADRKALIAEEAKLRSESADEDAPEAEPDDGPEAEPDEPDEAPETDAAPEAEPEDAAPETAPDEDAEPVEAANGEADGDGEVEDVASEPAVDTVGGDDVDDAARHRARRMRRYKIQEVIKRRQVILVQVTKEERGNKGAALTSYLSLAGRYCVLMPNTGKGGGISRKISNPADRRRLKKVVENLEIPEGVAVIVRTAGSERTKVEIKRDYEYLLRLWGEIRDNTLASMAPSLIYEEANLIKRAMRDLYQSDMDEILVDGEDGHKHAKAFMKSLMPSHARKVQLYKDPTVPLFYRHQVESQIDSMHNATVQLKSGGYIVINMTEALVAIDVNSGKATRERHIEGTAYKTNLEAAEEVARQQRLRDLAGLIVIDFIDMEESRHNRAVERKLKEAMRLDRARIQLGRISPFGLLEMSRQRLRPSLFESSTVVCPNCNANGYVRTTESMALHVLRGLEEEGIRRGAGEVLVSAPPQAALHLLNRMRDRIVEIEQRYGFQVRVEIDESLIAPNYNLERLSLGPRVDGAEDEVPSTRAERPERSDRPERSERSERPDRPERSEGEGERSDRGDRKRTRGRRRRRRGEEPAEVAATEPAEIAEAGDEGAEGAAEAIVDDRAATPEGATPEADGEDKPKRRRRRGKRGGRRRARRRDEETSDSETEELAAGDASGAEAPKDTTEDEQPAPLDAVAAEDGKADAPKPKRRRAPRKKKAAVEVAEVTADADAPEESGQAATDAETDAEAKPKRKRSATKATRAPRKKAAAKKKAASSPDAPSEPAPAPREPEEASAPRAASAPPSETVSANGGDSPEAQPEVPAAPPPEAEAAAPRRRGWWQKFT
jgi:ribonuclease E